MALSSGNPPHAFLDVCALDAMLVQDRVYDRCLSEPYAHKTGRLDGPQLMGQTATSGTSTGGRDIEAHFTAGLACRDRTGSRTGEREAVATGLSSSAQVTTDIDVTPY